MKFNTKSFGFKLRLYFILFAAVILISLWLMQIVFLQSFYESMKTADIAKIADEIIDKYGSDDFEKTVDRITFRNSILVFVTDTQGTIIYASDEHGSGGPGAGVERQPDMGGKGRKTTTRPLPIDYVNFLLELSKSANGHISYTVNEDRFQGKSLIYGARIQDAVLYVSSPLDPVNSTTGILRTQLVYVTIASLLFSLIIAYFIARKFVKPVAGISKQAAELAKGDFGVSFDKGFCTELDELACTLDHTALELSKVEKLRRELIANISHDLRTPLTMIKAYTEMIRDISGDNKEKREAHLSVITGETDRLTALVDDILNLSVIQSGNDKLELTNLNLSDTVKKVVSGFQLISENEGQTISVSIEPDQYVLGDGQKLTQVLYNLIGNARNYVGDDGIIYVELKNLGGRVRFEVTDHGDGIPEDELNLIWDRYYKSKGHERGKAGTGLGLSIVKGILEMHGARFGVQSSIDKGSTFWFELKK